MAAGRSVRMSVVSNRGMRCSSCTEATILYCQATKKGRAPELSHSEHKIVRQEDSES